MNLVDLDPTPPCDDIELDLEFVLRRIEGAEAIMAWGMVSST